jgi:hypothetical protein
VLGEVTDVPWAARYFIERVHPVGLYRAAGLAVALTLCLLTLNKERPARTLWMAILGYALVHLVADAWLRDPVLIEALRRNQVVALAVAVVAAVALALEAKRSAQRPAAPAEPPPAHEGTPAAGASAG